MMELVVNRFIANLKFGTWEGRLYFAWSREGDGAAAFQSVMKKIETDVGPRVKSLSEFTEQSKAAFQEAGFALIRP
jgi:hypothetical protein